MTAPEGPAGADDVRRMFDRIAPRYDLLNTLMTLGRDRAWRRETIRRLELDGDPRLLDLGAGTGDLGLEARRRAPAARVAGADFAPKMLRLARKRQGAGAVGWLISDALHLPFAGETFDGVVSGFLLRNVSDRDLALAEQYRVLRRGGRLACLDTTPLQPGLLRPLLEIYLRRVIPTLGRLIAGDAEAYNYLPASTVRFLSAEELGRRLTKAGFRNVGFTRRMFGTIAIHWGERPGQQA